MHRVLIVKDSPTMRQSLAFALKRMKNIEIVEVQDGIRGLCKVPRDHFDLVLIDIRMPVMDGMTLISRVRDEQNLRRMPICVRWPQRARTKVARAMRLGANAYLTSRSKRSGCCPSRRRSSRLNPAPSNRLGAS